MPGTQKNKQRKTLSQKCIPHSSPPKNTAKGGRKIARMMSTTCETADLLSSGPLILVEYVSVETKKIFNRESVINRFYGTVADASIAMVDPRITYLINLTVVLVVP